MPQEGQIASAPGKPTLVYTGGKWRPQGSQSGGMMLGGPDRFKVNSDNRANAALELSAAAASRQAAAQEQSNFNNERNFNQTQDNNRVSRAATIRQDFNADPDVKV